MTIVDRMSAPLQRIYSSVNNLIGAMQSANTASGDMFDIGAINNGGEAIRDAAEATDQMRTEMEEASNAGTQMTNNMNQQKTAAEKLTTAIKGIAAAYLGVRGIRAFTGFLQDSFSLYETQTKAETQLKLVLSNMVEDYDSAYNAINAKAKQIQAAGMYGDEAMLAGAGELATYFTDPKAIVSMMDTLANYAAGMSLGGEVDATSMVDYATGIGKMMSGAYDAMTKKGFEVTDQQKAIIEGTATQAQIVDELGEEYINCSRDMQAAATINNIIEESWSGLYATMSKTPSGQIAAFRNQWGDMKETIGSQLAPVVSRFLTNLEAHIPQIGNMLSGIVNVLSSIIMGALTVFEFISDNWSIIAPIILGIVAALAIWTLQQHLHEVAIKRATMAQLKLNAAMSPVLLILTIIIAIVAAVYAVASAIAKLTGVASTGFGVITGAINVVIQFFKNLGLTVANIALAMWGALGAVGWNIKEVFIGALNYVQAGFWDFLGTVTYVLAQIMWALDKIPFVDLDWEGMEDTSANFHAKAQQLRDDSFNFKDVGDAFSEGLNTFDTFSDGWAGDAFEAGASWGDGVAAGIEDALGWSSGSAEVDLGDTNLLDSGYDYEDTVNNMGDDLSDISTSNKAIADSVSRTSEELKYLREIAERQAINQFTTAEIKIDMSGMQNKISSDYDVEEIGNQLAATLLSDLQMSAEGVHV